MTKCRRPRDERIGGVKRIFDDQAMGLVAHGLNEDDDEDDDEDDGGAATCWSRPALVRVSANFFFLSPLIINHHVQPWYVSE